MWRGHYQTKTDKCPSADNDQSNPGREIKYRRFPQMNIAYMWLPSWVTKAPLVRLVFLLVLADQLVLRLLYTLLQHAYLHDYPMTH